MRVVAQTKVQGKAVCEFPCVLRIDADNIARLLPGLSGAYAATNLKGQSKNEVRSAIACVGHRNGCRGIGEPAVKVHQAKFAIVACIESLDDITPVLAAKFQRVPAARPADRIFELPDFIIKARRALLGPQVRQG